MDRTKCRRVRAVLGGDSPHPSIAAFAKWCNRALNGSVPDRTLGGAAARGGDNEPVT